MTTFVSRVVLKEAGSFVSRLAGAVRNESTIVNNMSMRFGNGVKEGLTNTLSSSLSCKKISPLLYVATLFQERDEKAAQKMIYAVSSLGFTYRGNPGDVIVSTAAQVFFSARFKSNGLKDAITTGEERIKKALETDNAELARDRLGLPASSASSFTDEEVQKVIATLALACMDEGKYNSLKQNFSATVQTFEYVLAEAKQAVVENIKNIVTSRILYQHRSVQNNNGTLIRQAISSEVKDATLILLSGKEAERILYPDNLTADEALARAQAINKQVNKMDVTEKTTEQDIFNEIKKAAQDYDKAPKQEKVGLAI